MSTPERGGFLAAAIVRVVRVTRLAGRAAWSAVRRSRSVVTPLGAAVIIAVPLALAAALLLGWVEFAVIGWGALVLSVCAALFLIGRAPLDMQLELPHRSAVVGQPARGVLRGESVGRRSQLSISVEIPVGAHSVELVLPGLRKGATHREEFEVPTTRRGVVTIGPVRTVRADPVGLFRRELTWTGTREFVVHPRTVSVPATSTGLIRDLEGTLTRDLTNSDVAFHALREYQLGDERRYIHWKSTAKTGVHMVRQFEQTRRSHLVVAVGLSPEDYANEDEFELAVGVAGSLGVRAIRDGRTVSVVVPVVTPERSRRRVHALRELATRSRDRLLDDLAVIEASARALPMRDIVRLVAESAPGISVAFLVCGSRMETSELRSAAAAFPAGVAVIAVVCDPDAIPGMRRLAGLDVLTIGSLDELRVALSRAAALT